MTGELALPPDCDLERHRALHAAVAELAPDLLTPALVIDLDAAEHNIARLVETLGPGRWSPHIKTVKQSALLKPLLAAGVRDFKCATLDELALLLRTIDEVRCEGARVLLAYPLTEPMLGPLTTLASRHRSTTIAVLLDAPQHARWVDRALTARGGPRLEAVFDVDVGMHRTGSAPQRWRAAWAEGLRLHTLVPVGLHAYEGHLQWDEREQAFEAYDEVVSLARDPEWKTSFAGCRFVLTSGSHAFHHASNHPGLSSGAWQHQLGPGTLVLSDLRSAAPARALSLKQAAFVATRVVSAPTPDRITLDAGSKAIAPDRPAPALAIVGHPTLRATTPSEEHHPVRCPSETAPAMGSILFAVPDHVCTTVNLHREAIYLRTDRFVGVGPIEAMGHRPRWDDQP